MSSFPNGESVLRIGDLGDVGWITIMINMHSLDQALFPGVQFGFLTIVFGDVRELLGTDIDGFLG